MNYFYARVSTREQNEARQLDAMKAAGIDAVVYVDKESGKSFDRTNWKILDAALQSGDVLFVKSIDRLGRNYDEIIRVWQDLVKERDVDIVVLDMPILDTRRDKNLIGKFLADVVLQLLSFVAAYERDRIRERCVEGTAAAKARGVKWGRPQVELPDGFEEIARQWLNGDKSLSKCAAETGLAYSTFAHHAKRIGDKLHSSVRTREVYYPEGFDVQAERWFNGEASSRECADALGLRSRHTFTRLAHEKFPDQKAPNRRNARKIDVAPRKPREKKTVKPNKRLIPKGFRNVRLPSNFEEVARLWLAKEIPDKHACMYVGMNFIDFKRYATTFADKQ